MKISRHELIERLRTGDMRSVGNADSIALAVQRGEAKMGDLLQLIAAEDKGLAMRAADAAEKVSRTHPEQLAPFKRYLLDELTAYSQQEICWHLVLMIARLELDVKEQEAAAAYLDMCSQHPSKIVQANALEAYVIVANTYQTALLRSRAKVALERARESTIPSLRARARKLLLHK